METVSIIGALLSILASIVSIRAATRATMARKFVESIGNNQIYNNTFKTADQSNGIEINYHNKNNKNINK